MDGGDASALSLTGGPTRRAVLHALRREGRLSPDRLSTLLRVSRTAVLQQLRSLRAAGLVARHTVRHGVGRPRHFYELTEAAQAQFPSNYQALSRDMLASLEAIGGPALVERVFTARRERLAGEIRARFTELGLEGAPLHERVRELARFQDEQGYLCECRTVSDAAPLPSPIKADEVGVLRLSEHNCAIYEVATATPAACRAEVQLFRDVLGARVVRETHIAAGDRSCTYRIEERSLR